MRIGMSVSSALIITTLVFIFTVNVPAAAQGMFALDVNPMVIDKWHQEPWPQVTFGSLRLWDAHTAWREINTANGVYDWSVLDAWLGAAQTGGQHVLYTFGQTPQWASSNPNDIACTGAPGACDPPDDLNPDGSGTDQHWKDFVTALALRSKNSTTAHIEAWELWNEPFATWQWTGTYAQMVRMAGDATGIIKSFDPNAIVLSPSVDWAWGQPMTWLANYFAAGGSQYADAIAVHGYVYQGTDRDEPEDMVGMAQKFRAVLSAYGQDAKPVWDTEASWRFSHGTRYQDPDMQAGWLARFYVLHRSSSIKRLFWYSYNSNDDYGTLWVPDPKDRTQKGTLLKPGIAFENLRDWMIGAKMTTLCSATGTVWSCGLSRPEGYQGLLVWDTSGTCKNGNCTATVYPVGSQYVRYRTLDGNAIPIAGGTVPIGAKPILVQNR
jgi:hypothetical protein